MRPFRSTYQPTFWALLILAGVMFAGTLACGSQSTPPRDPPDAPTKEPAQQSPSDRPNAKPKDRPKDRPKATPKDTVEEASSANPRLFVLATQINTEVVNRGEVPTSREAQLSISCS